MIVDGRTVADGGRIEAEVCIIGSGPAGLTLARELMRSGVDVSLVESGGLDVSAEAQELAEGEVSGLTYDPLPSVRDLPYGPLAIARARRFGGTSTMWNLDVGLGAPSVRLRRLEPGDLEPRDDVGRIGWPFGIEELLPFYERAEAILGLGPVGDGRAPALSEGAPILSPDGPFERRLFSFARRDVFTEIAREEVDASESVSMYLNGTVTRVLTDDSGERITAVRVATLTGTGFSVEAGVFVLAAGGIENARLLLVSDGPDGSAIGNEHDLVGRYFMEHPHIRTGVVVPAGPRATRAIPSENVRLVDGRPVEDRLALRRSVLEDEGLLDAVLTLIPFIRSDRQGGPAPASVRSLVALRDSLRQRRLPENLSHHLRNVIADPVSITRAGGRKVRREAAGRARRRLGSAAAITDRIELEVDAMSEQAPDPESRVTLSDRVDRLGVPKVRLDWKLSSLDLRTLVRTHELLQREMKRTGLGSGLPWLDVERLPPRMTGGHHHMGTTRMHADPSSGVVDGDCRVHGMANLFVAGSSVFPTSGSANPTLTIVALAVRLADHLKHRVLGLPAIEADVSRDGVLR